MYDVFTDVELLNKRNIEDLEDAYEVARQYAAHGCQVEIREQETGDTVALFNCDDE